VNVDTTDLMRKDWDERARKDAFHYIGSWRKDWTPESFFQSGEEDFQRFVVPVFERCILESNNLGHRGTSSRSFRWRLYRTYERGGERLKTLRSLGDTWYMVFWKR
jgi:hypothetical protein